MCKCLDKFPMLLPLELIPLASLPVSSNSSWPLPDLTMHILTLFSSGGKAPVFGYRCAAP